MIAHRSNAAPYAKTVHTETNRAHLNPVQRSAASIPSPSSSNLSDASVPLSVLYARNDRGGGHLWVNLSVAPIDLISAWCPESIKLQLLSELPTLELERTLHFRTRELRL